MSSKDSNFLKNASLYEKLKILYNSSIRISSNASGIDGWISDNSEKELLQVKEILKDNEVYQAIVRDDNIGLNTWLKYFDRKIIYDLENIKLLAVNKPTFFGYVLSEETRNDVELMRKCSCQNGIHPSFIGFVGKNVQDDFMFITNLIINSDENTFDFYGSSAESLKGSNMRYGKSIGISVRSNPYFWLLLNSKIASINENSSRKIPLFSVEEELNLVRMSSNYDKNDEDSHIIR